MKLASFSVFKNALGLSHPSLDRLSQCHYEVIKIERYGPILRPRKVIQYLRTSFLLLFDSMKKKQLYNVLIMIIIDN